MIMPLKFIDREFELDILTKEYSKKGFTFTIIYGRRRVGKTELVRHFINGKKAIYFQCDKRGVRANIESMRKVCSRFFDDVEPSLASLNEIFHYIIKRKEYEKIVFIIDEFPYLIQQDGALTSELQRIIDTFLIHEDMYLIILGSSIGMMKDELLSEKSPLYGRRTSQLEIRPFGFRNLIEWFPQINPKRLVKIYGAFGGMPFYLQFINQKENFFKNLERTVFNKSHVLYPEGEFVIRSELSQVSSYMKILQAIASGASKVVDIAVKSGIKASDLPHYLDRLRALDIIHRERPILGRSKKSKKSLYFLSDNFLQFWFRYVLPYGSMIEIGNLDPIFDDLKRSYDTFLGRVFEQISREYLMLANKMKIEPIKFTRLGSQWGKIPGMPKGRNEYEIDHIAIDMNEKSLIIAESKWQNNVNPVSMEKRLNDLVKVVPELSRWKTVHLIGFARSFRKTRKDLSIHTVDLKTIHSTFKSSLKSKKEI